MTKISRFVKKYLYFGEEVKGYSVRVLNEREARAGAGILFFLAIISFMNAFLIGNFNFIKIFVVGFLIDFFIRVVINPKYSISLILGRIFVSNQIPEYVGAPQKRFAWALGLILAIVMFFILVVYNYVGIINLIICIFCLALLFLETAFGICVGCKMYNLFFSKKAELCPGGVCMTKRKEEIQKVSFLQVAIVLLFFGLIFAVGRTNLLL